uniref:Claudin n=1 Tax=Labrus bergylta TaxID=56723 RepID=A0A3Q3FRY7_9LABR
MASAALELMGFFLGLLGMLGTLVATVLPYWQISAHIGSNIVTAVASMRGLWMECVYQSTGTSRALMVISIVLSILAIAISVLGMQCTLCLEGTGTVKNRVAGTGGGLFLAAGFMALIPVAWTTHEVVQTFYRPNLPASMKFELGECLYVGLASSFTSTRGPPPHVIPCSLSLVSDSIHCPLSPWFPTLSTVLSLPGFRLYPLSSLCIKGTKSPK